MEVFIRRIPHLPPPIVDQGNNNPLDAEFFIGANLQTGANNREWNRALDDIARWDRVLSADEVAQIYAAGENGIALGAIPEPSPALLTLLAGTFLLIRRRK
ncbi:MAG: PEP-CTERM sorting domain-containing protein [Akkermansiaceae bacterium]|nr:PEP-CTERM sorting domain-containing protein [Akkermansiaceae bacterium]